MEFSQLSKYHVMCTNSGRYHVNTFEPNITEEFRLCGVTRNKKGNELTFDDLERKYLNIEIEPIDEGFSP